LNGVKISAVGHYAPAAILTNEDLEKTLDTSDEWITTRTGMKRRHIASEDQATSDLCIAAARNALRNGKLASSDIDCYIVATSTPDYAFPATACIVAAQLDAVGKPAFDMEIACSGFIYGRESFRAKAFILKPSQSADVPDHDQGIFDFARFRKERAYRCHHRYGCAGRIQQIEFQICGLQRRREDTAYHRAKYRR